MVPWEPRKRNNQDDLLATYHGKVKGRMYAEVPVPSGRGHRDWDRDSDAGWERRRINAIRVEAATDNETIVKYTENKDEAHEVIEDASVKVIEISLTPSRRHVGHVIVGQDLLEADYRPSSIKKVILGENIDSDFRWVCEQRDIEVVELQRDESAWVYEEKRGDG